MKRITAKVSVRGKAPSQPRKVQDLPKSKRPPVPRARKPPPPARLKYERPPLRSVENTAALHTTLPKPKFSLSFHGDVSTRQRVPSATSSYAPHVPYVFSLFTN